MCGFGCCMDNPLQNKIIRKKTKKKQDNISETEVAENMFIDARMVLTGSSLYE